MIYQYKDGLIGWKSGYTTREFLSIKEYEEYNNNLNIQSVDWEYRNIKIYYDFNQYGHRCKSINDLSDNYILFAGCSHTMGTGLRLEDTYSFLVAKHYNIDYYNLSIPGGSVNAVFYNMVSFLNKVKIKPKKIFIQWPDESRILLNNNTDNIKNNENLNNINLFTYFPAVNNGSKQNYDKEVYQTLLKHNVPSKQSILYRNLTLDYISTLNIDTYEIEATLGVNINKNTTNYIKISDGPGHYVDHARDFKHGGIKTNLDWASIIVESVDKKILSTHL